MSMYLWLSKVSRCFNTQTQCGTHTATYLLPKKFWWCLMYIDFEWVIYKALNAIVYFRHCVNRYCLCDGRNGVPPFYRKISWIFKYNEKIISTHFLVWNIIPLETWKIVLFCRTETSMQSRTIYWGYFNLFPQLDRDPVSSRRDFQPFLWRQLYNLKRNI